MEAKKAMVVPFNFIVQHFSNKVLIIMSYSLNFQIAFLVCG